MIRIHSGKLKGQSISRPHLETTKETSSMVREAVFNSLHVINGDVLDLFAGSGSYGFTAYSLGANNVTLVEYNKVASKNLVQNIKKLNVESNIELISADYKYFLKSNTKEFDYIFLDPPFDFSNYLELLEEVSKFTKENSLIILEQDKRSKVIESFKNFEITKNKTYGSKRIIIYGIL